MTKYKENPINLSNSQEINVADPNCKKTMSFESRVILLRIGWQRGESFFSSENRSTIFTYQLNQLVSSRAELDESAIPVKR